MEKSGMGGGRRSTGPGLLGRLFPALALGALLFPAPLCPAEGDVPLILSVEATPENPEPGLPWTVLILVNHPNPAQVMVTPPEPSPPLSLERLRIEARFVRGVRLTQVELQCIPQRAGPILLEPFEISVPGMTALSPELRSFAGDPAAFTEARLAWEGIPSSLTLGRGAELRLRMTPPPQARPPSFHAEAPEGALLEELPVDEAGRLRGIVLRLRVIPLEGPELRFPPGVFPWGETTLEVPGWRIPVLPAPALAAGLPVSEEARPAIGDEPEERGILPFPANFAETPPGFFAKVFGDNYTKALDEARRHWDNGSPGESLACLRRYERDFLSGRTLAFPRRIIEAALGVGPTEDEPWRPRFLFPALILGSLALLGVTILAVLFRRRAKFSVTSGFSLGYRLVIIVLLAILGTGSLVWLRSRGERQGIVRETGAYRVPDIQSGPGFHFREGEPIRIRSSVDAWAYVESFDGKAGWIPLDRLIPY